MFGGRPFCRVGADFTREEVHTAKFKCGVGGHAHFSFKEVFGRVKRAEAVSELSRLGEKYVGQGGLLERGEVEWLCFPRVLRLVEDKSRPKGLRIKLNDLSARVGPYLAGAVRQKKDWAQLMLSEIQGLAEPPQKESGDLVIGSSGD